MKALQSLKYIAAAFLLILGMSVTGMSAEITVAANTITNWTFGGATATIRIYSERTIVTTTPVRTIMAGTTAGFYKTVSCTVAGTTLSCASLTIDTTTDSNIPSARFIADLYDSDGRVRTRFFDRFSVPTSLGMTITWEQLRVYNTAAQATLVSTYLTANQTNVAIAAAIATIPPGNSASLASTYSNNLATAVAAIGSINPTRLLINANTTCSTAITVTANIYLVFENGAKISEVGTCTIAFAGFGIADPMVPLPIFADFETGDITWTGTDWPSEVSSELFYNATDSVSLRLIPLNAAFPSNKTVTFVVNKPRPVTVSVTLSDYHSIKWRAGVYGNTWQRTTVPPFPPDMPFILGSYSRFTCEAGAILKGSNVDYNNGYIETENGGIDIRIEGCHFQGQDIQFNGVNGGVVLYGCTNCHVRKNWFDAFENYNVSIVSDGTTHSQDSSIEDNLFTGFLTQLAHISDCERCQIQNNRFTLKNVGLIGAVIDLEPNVSAEHVDDILVENNYIYLKNNQLNSIPAVGTVTLSGNARSIVTAAGMPNSPKTVTFAVTSGDTAETVAIKMTAALRADADVGAFFDIKRTNGIYVYIARKTAAAEDLTQNLTIEDVTSAGITDDTTADSDVLGTTVYGITANPASTRGFQRLTIRNNTLVNDGRFGISTGIGLTGGSKFEISGNNVYGGKLYPIFISGSSGGKVFNNHAYSPGRAYIIAAVGGLDFYNNIVVGVSDPGGSDLEEYETFSTVNTSGTTATFSYPQASSFGGNSAHVYESFVGMTIEFNAATYTIATVTPSDTFHSLTTTTSLPTISSKSFTTSASFVIVGTDTIDFGVAHGMSSGCAFFYDVGGDRIGGMDVSPNAQGTWKFYAISTGANTIKVATTKANALAGTAIDLTSIGTGLQVFAPVFETRFANNRYRENDVPAGYSLEPTGTSKIYSKLTNYRTDGTVTIDPADLAANTCAETTVTITGAATGDKIVLVPPSGGLTLGLLQGQARISATDTVKLPLCNVTSGSINQASGSWGYTIFR